MELHAVERCRARRRVTNGSPYSAVPSTSSASAGTAAKRVHVVEGARRRAGPRSAATRARQRTSFQPMCGSFSAAGARARAPRRRAGPRPVGAAVLARALEQQLHAEADAEHRHARRRRARASSSSRPSSRRLLHRPREGADAGQRPAPSAARSASGSALIARARADVLERLLDRAAVAHPVVDDRDLDGVARSSRQRPLRARHAGLGRGRSRPPARSARANALNAASIMWWALRARLDAQVQRQLRRVGERRGRTPRSARARSRRSSPAAGRPRTRVNGRPEMSIAQLARASSIGTVAEP